MKQKIKLDLHDEVQVKFKNLKLSNKSECTNWNTSCQQFIQNSNVSCKKHKLSKTVLGEVYSFTYKYGSYLL